MNISLIQIGKSDNNFLKDGIELYSRRLNHYLKTVIVTIPNIKERKHLTVAQIQEIETQKILQILPPSSFVVLLDENGINLSSTSLSKLIQNQLNRGRKEMSFIIGGAYGVSDALKSRADFILSLSQMTFTHQMVRLFILEQLYRAMTILRNEPYHNA